MNVVARSRAEVTVDRAVEVLHDRGPTVRPQWTVGSGFLVGGRMVLTAAHSVGRGEHLVRANGGVEYRAEVRCRGRPGELSDLALIEIVDPGFDHELAAVPYADVDRTASETIESCWAVGFPAFKERSRHDTTRPSLRDTVQVDGRIAPGTNRESGLLGLDVTQTPRSLPTGALLDTPWQGMSGAVVFARHPDRGSVAVGVVSEHALAEGESSLTVAPISAVTGLDDAARWWELLGRKSAGELLRLPAASVVTPSRYWATVDEIARYTPVLLERDQERTDLRVFATGAEGLRWIIGPPWSGKTALVAHLSRSVPPDVDVVAFFLVRRRGDADVTRFAAAVNEQLARLVGVEPPSPLDDVHALRDLWRQAVDQARESARHVLLIVDGLDEDVGPAAGLPSVAGVLPTMVGEHAHVLVTSRPYPELPDDVDVDHPLRRVTPVVLAATTAAKDLEQRATLELRAVLQPGGNDDRDVLQRGRRVLCLLAAARGRLAADDLATLAGEDVFDIEDVLAKRVARIVQPVGSTPATRFTFAHETLRERCEQFFTDHGLIEEAAASVMAWATSYADKAWPRGTPPYLLDSYPDLLAARAPDRLGPLVHDLAFVEAAVGRHGVDQTGATLAMAAAASNDGVAIARLHRLLLRESPHLRPPRPVSREGYVTQQLCLAALVAGDADLATRARARLDSLETPCLAPQWTTHRDPDALVGRFGRHFRGIHSIAITADDRIAVTGGEHGDVRLWDLMTAAPIGEPMSVGRQDVVVAIAQNGQRVVGGGQDGTVQVWDVATGAPVGPHFDSDDAICAVAISPDGSRVVSCSSHGDVKRWNGPGTAESLGLAVCGSDHDEVVSARITADGSLLLSITREGGPQLWDMATCELLVAWPRGTGDETCFGLSDDGSTVVAGGEDGDGAFVRVWDITRRRLVARPMIRLDDEVHRVALSPDGTCVVVGTRDGLQAWDSTGTPRSAPIATQAGYVYSLAISTDGRQAISGHLDGIARQWDLTVSPPGDEVVGHTDTARSVAISPDGAHVASGGWDGTVRVWDRQTGARIARPFVGGSGRVNCVMFSPDRDIVVSGTAGGVVQRWDVSTASLVGGPIVHSDAERRHDREVLAVALAGDLIVSGGADGAIRFWEAATNTTVGEPIVPPASPWRRRVYRVGITADGERVVGVTADGIVGVWNLSTHEQARLIKATNVAIYALVIDGGHVLIGGARGVISEWDLATGDEAGEPLVGHEDWVLSLGLIPDTRWLVSGSRDTSVRVWDLRTRRCVVEVWLPAWVMDVAISPAGDGTTWHLAVGDQLGSVSMWSLAGL